MTSIKDLTKKIIYFRDERNWEKFHKPKNLALSLIVEIGELFELIQWQKDEEIIEKKDQVVGNFADEVADVAIYLFQLAHVLGVDLDKAIPEKIEKNKVKYPVGAYSDEEIKWGKTGKS